MRYTLQPLLGADHHYKIKDYLDTLEEKKFNSRHSLNKNKLTIRHALWISFYVFITSIIVNIFVSFLIFSNILKKDYSSINYRFSPILFLTVLIVLFLYIKTRPDLDLNCLGFKKSSVKKALRYGIIIGLTLGISKILFLKIIGDPLFNINLYAPIRHFLMLLFHPVSLSGIWATISVGPLFEETFYRGLWYNVLREKMPRFVAAIIISLAFAVLHRVSAPIVYLEKFLLSLILTLSYEKTNNLYSSITAHILINFITFLFLKMH